ELRGKKRVEDASESTEFQHKSGSISENDYLKISLQLLQFQTDVEQSQFARGRRFTSLRDLKHRVSLRHSRGPRMSGQILALGNQDRAPLRRPFAHPLPRALFCRFHTAPVCTMKGWGLHVLRLPLTPSGRRGLRMSYLIERTRPLRPLA